MDLPHRFYVKAGLGRSTGFDTFYNENNDIPENKTFYANTNNRLFAGVGFKLLNSKHHELRIEPQASVNYFKEYSDFQTVTILNSLNQPETFRSKAFYDEGKTLGYGYSVAYMYKFKNVGLGLNVGFNRYGDYRMRNQNLNFVYYFNANEK